MGEGRTGGLEEREVWVGGGWGGIHIPCKHHAHTTHEHHAHTMHIPRTNHAHRGKCQYLNSRPVMRPLERSSSPYCTCHFSAFA